MMCLCIYVCVTIQIRCHKYWPEDNKPMSVFSDILISKVSEEVLPDWTVRTLKVEKVTNNPSRTHTKMFQAFILS